MRVMSVKWYSVHVKSKSCTPRQEESNTECGARGGTSRNLSCELVDHVLPSYVDRSLCLRLPSVVREHDVWHEFGSREGRDADAQLGGGGGGADELPS